MKFFTGQRLKIIDNYTPIKCSPNIDSETVSEALYGENFILKKIFKNWLWGKLESDNYEGSYEGESGSFYARTKNLEAFNRLLNTFDKICVDFNEMDTILKKIPKELRN